MSGGMYVWVPSGVPRMYSIAMLVWVSSGDLLCDGVMVVAAIRLLIKIVIDSFLYEYVIRAVISNRCV